MRNRIYQALPGILNTLLLFAALSSNGQQQTVTTFSPANAGTGETVTITGTNYASITSVKFGGTDAASFTVVSPTKITALVGAGASGNVSVSKTGFADAVKSGFTFSAIPTVTRIITDFGGFWNTNTTTNNGTYPNDAHQLLGFTYGGVTYGTGVNNGALSDNGVAYNAATYRALPAIMNGTTSGASLFIVAASKMDGNAAAGLYTHPEIKDLTIQKVLSDGANGLNLGTGYTNLPTGATSNFNINSIQISKAADDEPDLVITQIADPSTSAFDSYRFLDASNNIVGNQVQIDLSKLAPLGTYYLDLFTVATGVPFSQAKPTGISAANTSRQIRFMAFKLSDFGIDPSNYSLVKRLQIIPSGVTDMAFVAYNTAALNVPPSIIQDLAGSNFTICSSGGGSAFLAVTATAVGVGALSYSWEVSTDNGANWSPVSNGGIYSGATTAALTISSGTAGYRYRATVTEAGAGYTAVSNAFTIASTAGVPLSGTINPAGFSNCLNGVSGTTALTVTPAGGTGAYNYQWSSSSTLAGVYTDIPGAIYNTYSPPLDVAGTLYYKVRISSGCVSNVSAAASVVIAGEEITSVTNGFSCSSGSVALSATASAGTVNWYSAISGGSALGSGNTFNTPSIASTTNYYVSTTAGSCTSVRMPVVATIINSISLSSANFAVPNATNVCVGSSAEITVASSALIDGIYNIQYSVSGANTIPSAVVAITFSGGIGYFNTAVLMNAGANVVTITGVQAGSCTIAPASGNTANFTVNAGSPLVSNFSLAVADGCSNASAVATVSSSTLASGTYILHYNVSGNNLVTNGSAQMIFTAGSPGTGTFPLPQLVNNGGSNVVTITDIAQLSAPDCSSALAVSSPAFTSSAAPVADAGNAKSMCSADPAFNISIDAFAANYSSLTWSSSNGTGTFTNNSTAQALSNTTYQPSSADLTRGWAYMTLTAAGDVGCAAVNKTIVLSIAASPQGGTVSSDQVITAGAQPADLLLSGFTGSIIKWQKDTDPAFGAPSDIAVTTAILSGVAIGPVSMTTYVRAVLSSGSCENVSSAAIISVNVLPVNMAYMAASCEATVPFMKWTTAQESNSAFFEVQKSMDAVNWHSIRIVNAAGNSSTPRHYVVKDSMAKGFNGFYRLRQTDVDGHSTIYEVLQVGCGSTWASEFSVSPNPARNVIVLQNLPAGGRIQIKNTLGAIVMQLDKYNGTVLQLNVSSLAGGIYYITAYTQSEAVTQKLLKE